MNPRKYSLEEHKNNMTMFYVDEKFELSFNEYIDKKVDDLYNIISEIDKEEGLFEYIKKYEDSLSDVLSLIGLSSEKFKRIVTMIRMWNNEVFRTEWDLKIIRKKIIEDENFKKQILELFLNGKQNELYKRFIPKYYLDYICIDKDVINSIEDKDRLKRLIKHKQDGKYNNDVGDKVEENIKEKLDEINEKYGVTYEREKNISWLERNMDFVIPNKENPHVIIESSYQITTSSAQTTKARDEVKTYEDIKSHREKTNKDIVFVNLIEGAGWIGRQSDMEKLYNASDYVIAINTLDMLEQIILKHVPDKYFNNKK